MITRQGVVLALEGGQGAGQQGADVGGRQVRLAVLAADWRGPAAHDDAVAALVEDVRHGGLQDPSGAGPVEGDADVAGVQVGGGALQPPGDAAGLVVERDVQVPRLGGFVLAAAPARGGLVPDAAPQDLQGDAEPQRAGLKQVVEVRDQRPRAVVPRPCRLARRAGGLGARCMLSRAP